MNAALENLTDWKAVGASDELPPWVIDGRVFRRPFAKVSRELTALENRRLERGIAEHGGIHEEILIDEFDNVIDGNNRLRIAIAQKIPLAKIPLKVIPNLTVEQKWDLAKTMNEARRHLTQDEIREENAENVRRAEEELRAENGGQTPSTTQIALRAGVTDATAKKHREKINSSPCEPDLGAQVSSASPKVLDARGRRQPSERLSPEARTLRQDRILSLVDAGQHSREQICEMLDISVGTYVQDLKAARARRDAAPKSSPSPAEAARSPLPPASPPPGEGSTPESPPTQEAPPSAPPECNAPGEPPADHRPPLETLVIRTAEKGNAIAAGRILNRESVRNMRKHGWLPHEIAEFLRVKIETVSDHLHEARPEQFTPPEERGDFDPAAAARHSAELSREPWVKALLQHLLRIRGAHDLGLQKIFRENFGGAKDAIKQAADILNALIEKLENYEEEGIC